MPGMDGTGPNGQGAMTGGGMGRCNAGAMPRQGGCGAARARGGFGFARRNFVAVNQSDAPAQQVPIEPAANDLLQSKQVLEEKLREANEQIAKLKQDNQQLYAHKANTKQVKQGKQGK